MNVNSVQVPESPPWLLSKDRPNDAQRSLQFLRGWVPHQAVHKEFSELQSNRESSNACAACAKESPRCYHPKPTFYDKIKEFKRSRIWKPLIFILLLHILGEFNLISIWQPYIIQVLIALGSPISPNLMTVINSSMSFLAGICLVLTVKKFGRRKLYLTSLFVATICSIGLSMFPKLYFSST